MHGLIFETSIWLLAGSTRLLPQEGFNFKSSMCFDVLLQCFSLKIRSWIQRVQEATRKIKEKNSIHLLDKSKENRFEQQEKRTEPFEYSNCSDLICCCLSDCRQGKLLGTIGFLRHAYAAHSMPSTQRGSANSCPITCLCMLYMDASPPPSWNIKEKRKHPQQTRTD